MSEWVFLLPLALLIFGCARIALTAMAKRRSLNRVIIWSPMIEARAASFAPGESQVMRPSHVK